MVAQTLLEALGLLLELVQEHMEKIRAYESTLKKMNSTLGHMKPIVEKMADLKQNLDGRSDGKTSEVLLRKIMEGRELIDKCSKEMKGCCSCWKKPRYGKQLEELHTSIKDYCDIIVQLEMLSKVNKIEGKVDKIIEGVDDLRGQKNSQRSPMQGNPAIGGQDVSRESKEQPEQPQSGTTEANHKEKPSPPESSRESKEQPKQPQIGTKEANHREKPSLPDFSRELKEHSEQPQSGTKERNHGEKLSSPPTIGAPNSHPFGSPEIGRDIKGREDSHPTRTPNNGTSNLHPPKSSMIGNDVKSTGHVDPSPVDSSASMHKPSASLDPAPKEKGSLEETRKPKQFDYANPPDDKGSKESLSGSTTSLAPVARLVPSKVKGGSILHPPKSPEIEKDVKPIVGHRDPSPVDSSASLHRPSTSLEPLDDKVSKRSPAGNTASWASVAPPVPSKVKEGSNFPPPKEIGNDVKSAGRRDPSPEEFSASLHRPFASSEPALKVKGFLEEAGKPRQLEYANPPDDKVNKRSLSDSVAPPVPSKVKASPEEPYKKIIGKDSKDKGVASMPFSLPNFQSQEELKDTIPKSDGNFNPVNTTNSSFDYNRVSHGPAMPPKPQDVTGINPNGQPWHSNDPTRRTSVPTAGSDSLSLRTSITSTTPPKLKEPDEGANHIPNSRKAGHSISSKHNSTVAKDHIPRGLPTVPEKTPDAKIIPEGVKNRPTELK